MVTKKTVKKPAVKRVTKLPTEMSLAEQLEETQTKLEMAVAALQFAREAMGMMSAKYEELYKSYEKAVKHIRKLERKLEKAE